MDVGSPKGPRKEAAKGARHLYVSKSQVALGLINVRLTGELAQRQVANRKAFLGPLSGANMAFLRVPV